MTTSYTAAVQPWVDAVRAVWPEARVTESKETYDIAIQEEPASVDGTWDAYVIRRADGARTAVELGSYWCQTPAELVAALRKHIPAPAPKPRRVDSIYECTCSLHNPPGVFCPGCTRLHLTELTAAAKRMTAAAAEVQEILDRITRGST